MRYGYEGNPPEWDYNYEKRAEAELEQEQQQQQQPTNHGGDMKFGKIETLEAELARIDSSNIAIIEKEMPKILDNPDLFFPIMTMMSKARGDEYRFHVSATKKTEAT